MSKILSTKRHVLFLIKLISKMLIHHLTAVRDINGQILIIYLLFSVILKKGKKHEQLLHVFFLNQLLLSLMLFWYMRREDVKSAGIFTILVPLLLLFNSSVHVQFIHI